MGMRGGPLRADDDRQARSLRMGKRSSFRIPRTVTPRRSRTMASLAPHLPQDSLRRAVRRQRPAGGVTSWRWAAPASGWRHRATVAQDQEARRAHPHRRRCATGRVVHHQPPQRKLPADRHLSDLGETWLLVDASWLFTQKSAPYTDSQRNRLRRISGRLPAEVVRPRWTAKDDVAWLKFDKPRDKPVLSLAAIPLKISFSAS